MPRVARCGHRGPILHTQSATVDGIEAHEAADLDVRNPALGNQPANVALREAQTFRHRTDVQQRREVVHISEWRVESRERDEKSRVKPSSHTLHHDARRPRETAAKIGTDMLCRFR
jgi:hypothetical protein